MKQGTRSNSVAVLAALVAALLAAYGAYQVVGWLGVGILGLLIAFIAVQADMDDGAPIGGQQNTGLYASSLQAQQGIGRAEKAERVVTGRATSKALKIATLIGTVLALVGLFGFFFLQLPR